MRLYSENSFKGSSMISSNSMTKLTSDYFQLHRHSNLRESNFKIKFRTEIASLIVLCGSLVEVPLSFKIAQECPTLTHVL